MSLYYFHPLLSPLPSSSRNGWQCLWLARCFHNAFVGIEILNSHSDNPTSLTIFSHSYYGIIIWEGWGDEIRQIGFFPERQ